MAENQHIRRNFSLIIPLVMAIPATAFGDSSALTPAAMKVVTGSEERNETVLRALDRGLNWLLLQQSVDGGWHSETYGNMKGGVGNTALVLHALAHLPDTHATKVERNVHRGVDFLTANLSDDGLVCGMGGVPDYPVYGTALLVTAMMESSETIRSRVPLERLLDGLSKSQRNTKTGWSREHPDYGGWSTVNSVRRGSNEEIPANISVTAHALQALNAAKSLSPAAQADALVFLERCQNGKTGDQDEGGFYFSPRCDDPLNKAGWFQTSSGTLQAHSYPSATCDGLTGLISCNVSRTDHRVLASIAWLSASQLPPQNPVESLEEFNPVTHARGLDFYTAAAFMRVHHQFDNPKLAQLQSQIIQLLLPAQKEDGSWSNPLHSMREDDPLIATALMVDVLARACCTHVSP